MIHTKWALDRKADQACGRIWVQTYGESGDDKREETNGGERESSRLEMGLAERWVIASARRILSQASRLSEPLVYFYLRQVG